MILLDFSNVMYSSVHANLGMLKTGEHQEDLLRHMVLNNLRSIRQKFKARHGDLVLAVDNKVYWRRAYFPYYKAARKKSRDASGLDWAAIFRSMNLIRDEVKEFMPYPVIDVEGAEADDVIGVLATEGYSRFVVSADKDFVQLQFTSPMLVQWDPIRKREVTVSDPEAYLREHVLRGDPGDGVPNVLSDDDVFVTDGKRQRPLTQKKIGEVRTALSDGTASPELVRNFERNSTLVDLSKTPAVIKTAVVESLESQKKTRTRSKMFNYFIARRLNNLMGSIQDF